MTYRKPRAVSSRKRKLFYLHISKLGLSKLAQTGLACEELRNSLRLRKGMKGGRGGKGEGGKGRSGGRRVSFSSGGGEG